MMSLVSATIALSIDTILPAFDDIEAALDLSARGSRVSLTVTVFLIGLGAGTILYGPLADRFGRKPIMYFSLAVFIAGALLSTFATTFEMFLAGRVIWGVGAAGPRTLTAAIIRDVYDGDLMSRILSLTSAVFLVVPVLAPSLGELLLFLGSWRWTTGIAAVLGVLLAVWLTRLNETLDPANVRPLRIAPVVAAAKQVLTNRNVMLYTFAAAMMYGAFFPWLGSSVQMIDEIYGRPGQFALVFGLNAALMSAAILASERLIARFGTRPVMLFHMSSTVAIATVYVIVASFNSGVPNFWVFFLMASALTSFNAASTPLTQSLAMEPMGAVAGMASSVAGVLLFTLGAVLGGLVDAQIRTTVTPFGVGFLIYSAIALAAVLLARPARQAEA